MEIGTVLLILISLAELLVAAMAAWKATKAEKGVTELHMIVNSRLDQLVKLAVENAHAAGKLEGEQTGRKEALEDTQRAVRKPQDDAANYPLGDMPVEQGED